MEDTYSSRSSILLGSTTFFLASVIVFIAKFATSIIIARSLGAEGKGIYTLTLMVGSLLTLSLDFGLTSASTYLIASNKYSPSEMVTFTFWATLLLSLVGGIIFFLVYEYFLSQNILAGLETIYILLIIILLPFNLLSSYYSAVILGLQRIIEYNLINITRMISNLGLQILSAYLGLGIMGAISSWLMANFIAFLLILWFLHGIIHFKRSNPENLVRESLSYGGKNYIANLMSFFNYRLDTFIINYVSGPSSVGLYSTGISAAELIWYIPNSISSTLFVKSAAYEQASGISKAAQVSRQTFLILFPITVISGLVGIFLIPFFYGEEFRASVIPFILILPGIMGMSLSKILSASLSGSGKPRYVTYTSAATVVITLLLDIYLIPRFDIAGAAIASSIAYMFAAVLIANWFTKEGNIPWSAVLVPNREDFRYLAKRLYEIYARSLHTLKQVINITNKP